MLTLVHADLSRVTKTKDNHYYLSKNGNNYLSMDSTLRDYYVRLSQGRYYGYVYFTQSKHNNEITLRLFDQTGNSVYVELFQTTRNLDCDPELESMITFLWKCCRYNKLQRYSQSYLKRIFRNFDVTRYLYMTSKQSDLTQGIMKIEEWNEKKIKKENIVVRGCPRKKFLRDRSVEELNVPVMDDIFEFKDIMVAKKIDDMAKKIDDMDEKIDDMDEKDNGWTCSK